MTVNWLNGNTNTQLAIVSLTATQITATVPAALISAFGSATVTVATADGAASGGATFTINRVPAITSLNPASRTAGAAAFTLTVNGTGFVNGGTIVNWNGSPRATTFVSATQLTAAISAADAAAAGTATVTLINVDGVSSNGLPFTITAGPAITSFSPASRSAGQGQFTLTINGANFAASDTVTWNGGGLAITSLTANQIQVTIPAALTQNSGTAQIAVISPDGVSSGNSPYAVGAVPTLTSISPASHTATFGTFTLTLNGANFTSGMTVNWLNGNTNTQLAIVGLTQLKSRRQCPPH